MRTNSNIIWSGYEWLTRQPWGDHHTDPNQACKCWYDPSAIMINSSNQLKLDILQHPKTFDDGMTLEYGIGIITSIRSFGYGVYKIQAMLPQGVSLWPAFWMYEYNKCIPEIDIFEGYSMDTGYKRKCTLKKWNVESCIHTDPSLNLPRVRAEAPCIWNFNIDPSQRFNEYSFFWTPDRVEFYINGECVRKVKDKAIISHLRDRKMTVILNNHISCKYIDNFNIISPFIINHFDYCPL